MTENENTGYAGLYHKLSDLRKDVLSKDWSDDKFFQMGTTGGFKYLSADKIIQTVSPLFMAHGLELRFNITDLQFRPALEKKSQHVTLTMTADIIDIDTGLYTSSTVMAEAADNGDMAVRKAHTVALKQWVLFQFMIADGIDEMAQESTGTGAFRRKTPEEQDEVRSKVLAQAEQPGPVAKAPAKPKAEVPKVPEPKEASVEEKKAPALEGFAKKPETSEKYRIAVPQQKMIDKIIDNWKARAEAGEIDAEMFNKMSAECASIHDGASTMAFIRKYMPKG